MHPSDSLIQRKNWDYYKQSEINPNVNSISGCDNSKRDELVSEIEGIRLLNAGRRVDGGIVEVKINNVWGGICDDGFTISEANVLCRQRRSAIELNGFLCACRCTPMGGVCSHWAATAVFQELALFGFGCLIADVRL